MKHSLGLGLQAGNNRPLSSSLTPGVATVTLDSSEEWSPASVPGCNPLLPLVFRLYGNGGNGGLQDGNGGGGGGGGAFVSGSRASWDSIDSFNVSIGTPASPGTSVAGNTAGVSDVSVVAGGGEDASGSTPGNGGAFTQTNGLTLTDTRAGGSGGMGGGGGNGGGGGASGSINGAGGDGDSGGSAGEAASADGGDGGYGGDGDVGGPGESPGGGGGGCSDPGAEVASGANGRVVILVPTLT